MTHPDLFELVEEPLRADVAAHLEVCAQCRTERALLASVVVGATPPSARTIDVDGGLVEVVHRVRDGVTERFARVEGPIHRSVRQWLSLETEGTAWLAISEPLPTRTVDEQLRREPSSILRLALQAIAGVAAVHRHGTGHGALEVSTIRISETGRLKLPPPSLDPAEPNDDWPELAGVLRSWGETAPLAGLEGLITLLESAPTADSVLGEALEMAQDLRWGVQRYVERAELGAGGMGRVTLRRDQQLDRDVALKELVGDRALVPRFLDEARLTARLQHPGVVAVHEVGELRDGRPFYTMEVVRGSSLAAALREETWSLRRLVGAFAQVCDTVAFAHSLGVVHRDLKPANVMLGRFGEVRVMDWGIAVELDGTPRRYGRAGTPGYMAPEQDADAPLDKRADVYALGVILAEILDATERDASRGAAQEALAGLAGECSATEPADRPPDASVVAQRVREWLDGQERRDRAEQTVADARSLAEAARAWRRNAEILRAEATEALEPIPAHAGLEAKVHAWRKEDEAERLEVEAEVLETRFEQALRTALDHHAGFRPALDELARVYRQRLVSAEQRGEAREAARLATLLEHHDGGRHQAWLRGDGAVTLLTDPPGADVIAQPYVERDRRLVPGEPRSLGRTPLRGVDLPRGSWLLTIRHPACEAVRYPVFLERGEHWDGVPPEGSAPEPIALPARGSLGEHDVYVPAGWFWAGGDAKALDPPAPPPVVGGWTGRAPLPRDAPRLPGFP